jgi:DNA polymerase I
MARKILLLDGNSLTYRAFFALPSDMATASGQVTNAVFGFTSMLAYLLNDQKPDLIGVTFDRPEPTFRHEMVKDYKAGRAETPTILIQQMGLVREVVAVLDLPCVELVGFEADDLLATLPTQACAAGDDVIIVTGDRDSYQLVQDAPADGSSGSIRVLYNKRGVSDYALYDEAGIVEKTGVHPKVYSMYASLRGDPSDNLPGVPGVGEKTAAKLINDYGDLDGVFIEGVAKASPKLRENLITWEEQVRSNARATPLIRDVPDVTAEFLRVPNPDLGKARELFKSLEFRALSDRILEAFGAIWGIEGIGGTAAPQGDLKPLEVSVRTVTSAAEFTTPSEGHAAIVGSWVGAEGRSELKGISLATEADVQFVPAAVLPHVIDALAAMLASDVVWVHGHKIKELFRSLHELGLPLDRLDALGLDTAVAGYLLDPAENVYALDELARQYAELDVRPPTAAPLGQLDFGGTAADDLADSTGRSAAAVLALVEPIMTSMRARGLQKLYDEIERPLIAGLARMEALGVRIDTTYLKELAQSLTSEAKKWELEVQRHAGEEFVVNSVPQLRRILFEKLELKSGKKTKTGYSTDAQALEPLREEHPIVDAIFRYRELEKLRSTYGENLINEVGSDGRIHATFNQTVARTGRLSSDQPNLHNIPIRSEEGRQFRRAFIPADGCEFLVADYNQIELRVIAHLAQDPGLVEAFRTRADVHTETAKRVFGVEADAVTLAMRSKAKMVSYGLAYGMESFGLAQRLSIPQKEAAEILNAYFEAFPNVRAYMDASVADARNKGFTETLFGRRRLIPDLQSPNYSRRMAAERQAMNAGIQGLAADIFKVALVRLDQALVDGGFKSRIILQVHDEIVVEVVGGEHDAVGALTIETMRDAAELDVPLETNVSWGKTWADAKG